LTPVDEAEVANDPAMISSDAISWMGKDVGKGERRLRRGSCGEAIVGCGTPDN
jgi:hypothetical protein